MMYELLAEEYGIYAVPYRNKRRKKPVELPDGTIVEAPTWTEWRHAPEGDRAFFEVPGEDVFLMLAGRFVLPSGDIAAVYGCKAQVLVNDPENDPDVHQVDREYGWSDPGPER